MVLWGFAVAEVAEVFAVPLGYEFAVHSLAVALETNLKWEAACALGEFCQ